MTIDDKSKRRKLQDIHHELRCLMGLRAKAQSIIHQLETNERPDLDIFPDHESERQKLLESQKEKVRWLSIQIEETIIEYDKLDRGQPK